MFKTKEIRTNTLGDKLKHARESMKISLSQVSKKTNIPSNYIEYLEKGNYNELPAEVYVVAYLKKYSKILNLNTKEILEEFKRDRDILQDLPEVSKTNQKVIVTPKRLTLIGGILVISLIFGFFWHQLNYLIRPPFIKIVQPDSDLTIQDKSMTVLSQTDSNVYLTINGKEVYVDNGGYFKSAINLELGLNILKIEAKDRFGKTNTIVRRVMVTQ